MRWHDVWSQRTLTENTEGHSGPTLNDLIVADGFNTGHGDIEVDAWREFTRRTYELFDLKEGDSLFDVGCGSGAFLYPASEQGIDVGGVDYSKSLIDIAKLAMPDGTFSVCEADELATSPSADVVMSFGVFLYFPSLDYARRVIERMCRKASRAVAIFEIPDLALASQALEVRQAAAGGAAAYAERYEGLGHLSYSTEWVTSALEEHGLVDVAVEPQSIRGYGNGDFRFNAWGWVRAAP
jgi:trans-aconitate methyltransferase